ncbi:MAG: hypothetical protein IPO60_08155 [Flavobacteriales bacterium]|nr:hypothetical protein [Flavobacteriales bacterium]
MSKETLFADFPALDAAAWENPYPERAQGEAPQSIAVTVESGTVLRPFATAENAAKQRNAPWH